MTPAAAAPSASELLGDLGELLHLQSTGGDGDGVGLPV